LKYTIKTQIRKISIIVVWDAQFEMAYLYD